MVISMKCEKASQYLSEYVCNELDSLTRWRVQKHIQKCTLCQEETIEIVRALNLLEADTLLEPDSKIWGEITKNVVWAAARVPRYPLFRLRLRYAVFLTAVAACFVFLFLLISPFSEKNEKGAVLWTFFNTDLWDFSGFFQKVDENKLVSFTPEIEERFKKRLKQELDLNTQDESRLFPLLQSFSKKMREYCCHYGDAMSGLRTALEQDKKGELEIWLEKLHLIREQWTQSRWDLLKDVRFILNPKQFGRFLIFTERLPLEIKNICGEAWDKKG